MQVLTPFFDVEVDVEVDLKAPTHFLDALLMPTSDTQTTPKIPKTNVHGLIWSGWYPRPSDAKGPDKHTD